MLCYIIDHYIINYMTPYYTIQQYTTMQYNTYMRVEAARAVEGRMEALVLVPGQAGLAHLQTCAQYSVV